MNEIQRIRDEYARRERALPKDRYSLHHPANLFADQQRTRHLLPLLKREGLIPLEGKTVLDIGCGDGHLLLDLISWGARREDLAGIDLIDARIAAAVSRLGTQDGDGRAIPDLRAGDASHLPWPDDTFDVVHQSTVFTSILDGATKSAVAVEMLRVLKSGGVLIWYDFLVDNPQNSQVKGIGAAELRSLFPGCETRLKRITLAPPIARRLVPLSWIGALLLEKLVMFNTHYLAVIRKTGSL